MYAQLCKRLSEEAPNFEPPNNPCTFKILLLNKCRNEFVSRSHILEQYSHKNQPSEDEDRRHMAKRKMLGNIRFIGELGKLDILSEATIHRCIQSLLTKRGDDPSEDLECLCQIMRTCGRILDTSQGKQLMDQYFERMSVLAENQELQPRIRFMLKDIIDLRLTKWNPRKIAVVESPVPIHQIRPADDDSSGFRRDRNNDRDTGSHMAELFRIKKRGGIEDMLINMNFNSPTNLIPTNPFPNGFGSQRDGVFRGHNNQRTSYNNYNNQRGQYKHNQNNSNTQYNNQSNKELAPRFKKNLIVARDQNLGELELRPAANSMLFNKASVKTNNIMNTRTIDPPITNTTPKPAPTPLLKDTLPIKQVTTEKPKQAKKEKGPSKEEVVNKISHIVDEYLKAELTTQQALDSYKDQKIPDKYIKESIFGILKTVCIEKNDKEKHKFISLLSALKNEMLVSATITQDSFKSLCNLLDSGENDKDKHLSAISVIFASGVKHNLIPLADIASITEHGAYYPLFIYVLQELKELIGEKDLMPIINDSKITLLAQLLEKDRTKERLATILNERKLTFLCPMLQLEADLTKQLQIEPNPHQFYKWIRENLENIDFNEPGFITALMTVLLKYITQEAAQLSAGDDKIIPEKEKALLGKYRPILHAFLHEKPALQLIAVYALQVHFYALGFPRGQLLRWFDDLYHLSIIEEEAFLTWKEDVTDVYPGKGQALFQVNQWLTWLQEAESEEEEEGEE